MSDMLVYPSSTPKGIVKPLPFRQIVLSELLPVTPWRTLLASGLPKQAASATERTVPFAFFVPFDFFP